LSKEGIMEKEIYFEIETVLLFKVSVTKDYWELITTVKHPVMRGKEDIVKETLKNPDEVRRSRTDDSVFLFYKMIKERRWISAVAKRLNGEVFLITTYPTDSIKEGELLWSK
jgi:hypothetical protein